MFRTGVRVMRVRMVRAIVRAVRVRKIRDIVSVVRVRTKTTVRASLVIFFATIYLLCG